VKRFDGGEWGVVTGLLYDHFANLLVAGSLVGALNSSGANMFDVFNEEIEVLIKDGVSNLYWYKGDLHKALLRAGVPVAEKDRISRLCDQDGKPATKRKQMDALYDSLRSGDFNRRLEISRNLVRILVEQNIFTPQDPKHRIEIAERCSLKLKEIVRKQNEDREYRDVIRTKAAAATKETYESKLSELRQLFHESHELEGQGKGYALERIFQELMRISGIPVEEPFKVTGEQLDGAIKYDGHYYLVELKWTKEQAPPKEISHFYFKVEGKYQARGIFISMNGFTPGAISTSSAGKEIRALLLDGVHISNVISDVYKFQELLEHAIRQATLKGMVMCSHDLQF